MTTKYQTQPTEIAAEQWDGSDDALRRVQELMFPSSPLTGRRCNLPNGDGKYQKLMVDCDVPGRATGTECKHASIGDWVVRWTDGSIDVVTNERFRVMFTPAVGRQNDPDEIAKQMGVPDAPFVPPPVPSLRDF